MSNALLSIWAGSQDPIRSRLYDARMTFDSGTTVGAATWVHALLAGIIVILLGAIGGMFDI